MSLRKSILTVLTIAGLSGSAGVWLRAQVPATPVFKSKVDLVVLTFTVTDSKGKYVTGLKPTDFKILEDGIQQKISTFAADNEMSACKAPMDLSV